MYLYDFKYDENSLSDFGFIVCEIDSDTRDSSKGAEIKFSLAPIQYGKRMVKTGSKYESTLSASFKICRDPDLYDENHMAISGQEFRMLERWLNRREFLWFRSYDQVDPDVEEAWFRATFTLSKYEIGGVTYAIELNMQTDSPFGYGDEVEENLIFTSDNLTQSIADKNDEIGFTYPDVIITCSQSGDLVIRNETTGCAFSVNHCSKDEVITQYGEPLILGTTLKDTHDIANDFNYDWITIANTFTERENVITASVPCELTIRYHPILKETI